MALLMCGGLRFQPARIQVVPRELGPAVEILREIAPEMGRQGVRLRDGPTFVLDYPKQGTPRVDGPLRIAKTRYFQMLVCHTGLHPTIAKTMDERLQARKRGGLSRLRDEIAKYHGTNPLRRPAPLGVSVSCIAYDTDGTRWVLVHKRTDKVAVNPGVWTTSVDEGMHNEHSFDDLAAAGLREEVNASRLPQDLDLKCVGLMIPDDAPAAFGGADSARSGANVLYEAVLESREHLQLLTPREHFEVADAKVLRVRDLERELKSEQVSETLAAWALERGLAGA